jgi:hypothetical protein
MLEKLSVNVTVVYHRPNSGTVGQVISGVVVSKVRFVFDR